MRSAGSAALTRNVAQYARRPRREDNDAVGEEHRLVDVVGDEDDRLSLGAPQLQELQLKALARQRVERAEGLVHQQHERIGGERAGDRHPLPHAS